MSALNQYHRGARIFTTDVAHSSGASAVLFLIGPGCEARSEPCLILNKRSEKVRQPGDLCCPGGGISPRMDSFLAKLLYLPGTPLTRWPYLYKWRKQRQREFVTMVHFFAGALRESFEEMRLNPLKVMFLGPLPPQALVMFRREIYPMVCWLTQQTPFTLNREVEKLVYIPLRNLLDPSNYIRYRLQNETPREAWGNTAAKDFPCFLYNRQDESEKLWGATFRISMVFLELVFGFRPPNIEMLPVVNGRLLKNYLTGSK